MTSPDGQLLWGSPGADFFPATNIHPSLALGQAWGWTLGKETGPRRGPAFEGYSDS